jgi:hypothetical protein
MTRATTYGVVIQGVWYQYEAKQMGDSSIWDVVVAGPGTLRPDFEMAVPAVARTRSTRVYKGGSGLSIPRLFQL